MGAGYAGAIGNLPYVLSIVLYVAIPHIYLFGMHVVVFFVKQNRLSALFVVGDLSGCSVVSPVNGQVIRCWLKSFRQSALIGLFSAETTSRSGPFGTLIAVDGARLKFQKQLTETQEESKKVYNEFRDSNRDLLVGSGYDPSTGVYVHDYGEQGIRALGDSLVITDSSYPIGFQHQEYHATGHQGGHSQRTYEGHRDRGSSHEAHSSHVDFSVASGLDAHGHQEHDTLKGHQQKDGHYYVHYERGQQDKHGPVDDEVPSAGLPSRHGVYYLSARQKNTIPQERASGHSRHNSHGPQQFFHRGSSRIPAASRTGDLQCPREGLYRHPGDCSKFYRCVNGGDLYLEPVMFACATGLAFDESLAACTWPENVPGCPNFSGLPSDNFPAINRHLEATQNFFQHTRPITPQPSARPMTESPRPTEARISSPVDVANRNPANFVVDTEEEPRCVRDGLIPTLPCAKRFYRCESLSKGRFRLHKYRCHEGMIFDQVIPGCIEVIHYPECQNRIQLANTTSATFVTPRPTPTTTVATASSVEHTLIVNGSSLGVVDPSLVIPAKRVMKNCGAEFDGDRCTPFYKCTDSTRRGRAFRFECPQNLVFNPRTEECAYPSEVDECEAFILDHPSDVGSLQGGKMFEISESNVIYFPCSRPGFYKDVNNCSQFIRCFPTSNDSLVLRAARFDCPRGLVFDEVAGACEHAALVPSCGAAILEHSNDILTMKCEFDPIYQDLCTPFYRCIDDSQRVMRFSCPKNLVYDIKNQQCNYPNNVFECRNPLPSKRDAAFASKSCSGDGFIRSSANCSLFYRCTKVNSHTEDFTAHLFSCPPGLVFDYTLDACNYDYLVNDCNHMKEAKRTATIIPAQDAPAKLHRVPASPTASVSFEQHDNFDTRVSFASVDSGGGFSFAPGTDRSPLTSRPVTGMEETRRRPAQSTFAPRIPSDGDQSSSGGFVFRPGSSVASAASTGNPGNTVMGPASIPGASQISEDTYPCVVEGFFRDTDSCRVFHRCVRTEDPRRPFVAHMFKCREGLVFDDVLKGCNYEDMVPECSQREIFETRPFKQTMPALTTKHSSEVTERVSFRRTTPIPQASKVTFAWRPGTVTSPPSMIGSLPERRMRPSTWWPHTTPESKDPQVSDIDAPLPAPPKRPTVINSSNTVGFSFKDTRRPTRPAPHSVQPVSSDESLLSPRPLPLAQPTRPSAQQDSVSTPAQHHIEVVPSKPLAPPIRFSFAQQDFIPQRHPASLRPPVPGQPAHTPFSPPRQQNDNPERASENREFVVAETDVIVENRIDHDISNDESEFPISFKCNPEVFYRKSTRFCTPFYRCTRTVVVTAGNKRREITDTYRYACPKGFVFDRELKTCDYPSIVPDCENLDPKEILPAPAIGSKSSLPCTREGYFGHSSQCNKYYRCVQVTRQRFFTYEYECPRGFVFNPDTDNCDYPDRVRDSCGVSVIAASPSCSVGIDYERSKTDCFQFYRCTHIPENYPQQPIPLACPGELVLVGNSCQWPDRRDSCYREDHHRRRRLLNDTLNNATSME